MQVHDLLATAEQHAAALLFPAEGRRSASGGALRDVRGIRRQVFHSFRKDRTAACMKAMGHIIVDFRGKDLLDEGLRNPGLMWWKDPEVQRDGDARLGTREER